MFLKLLKNKRIFIPIILLLIVISFFVMPKKEDKITIVEVEDGKPTIEKELVFFDVGDEKKFTEIEIIPKSQKTAQKPKNPEAQIVEVEDIAPPQVGLDDLGATIEVRLTGILYDKEEPSAIIEIDGNDYLVKVGDRVGDFDILGIGKNRIFFKDSIKNYTLVVGEVLYACLPIEGGILC